MNAAKRVLWIQLVLGLLGALVACNYIHWGAMCSAWALGLRAEFGKMQQSPGFQEPPAIRGQSVGRILEDLQAYGHGRADVAFYWLLTCGALVVLAVLVLWLLRGVPSSNKSLHEVAKKTLSFASFQALCVTEPRFPVGLRLLFLH